MTNRCQGVRDDSMTAGMSYAEKTLVPLVDLKAQSLALQPRLQARISETLSACRFILGPEVEELEHELAKFSAAFVDRHRGRVVHTSVDGLLAEFGSVIEAVQCAKKQNSYTGHYCLWDTGHKHRTTNCI